MNSNLISDHIVLVFLQLLMTGFFTPLKLLIRFMICAIEVFSGFSKSCKLFIIFTDMKH